MIVSLCERMLFVAVLVTLSTVSVGLCANADPADRDTWTLVDGEVIEGEPVRTGYQSGVGKTFVFLLPNGEERNVGEMLLSDEDVGRFAAALSKVVEAKRRDAAKAAAIKKREEEKRREQLLLAEQAERQAELAELARQAARQTDIEKVMAFPDEYLGKTFDVVLWLSQDSIQQSKDLQETFLASVCGGRKRYQQVPDYGNRYGLMANEPNFLLTRTQAKYLVDRVDVGQAGRFECTVESRVIALGDKKYRCYIIQEMRGDGQSIK
jgi:hypothetical protein